MEGETIGGIYMCLMLSCASHANNCTSTSTRLTTWCFALKRFELSRKLNRHFPLEISKGQIQG